MNIVKSEINMTLRFPNMDYDPEMSNSSTTAYSNVENEFCSTVLPTLSNNTSNIEEVGSCTVQKLEPGSVRVYFTFIVTMRVVQDESQTAIITAAFTTNRAQLNDTWRFDVTDIQFSIVTVSATTTPAETTTSSTAVPTAMTTTPSTTTTLTLPEDSTTQQANETAPETTTTIDSTTQLANETAVPENTTTEPSNETTSPELQSTTSQQLTSDVFSTTTSPLNTHLPPEVLEMANITARVGETVRVSCSIRHLEFLSLVEFLVDGNLVSTMIYESNNSSSLFNTISDDTISVDLLLDAVNCSDVGTYTCRAWTNSSSEEASMVLTVKREPENPTITFEGKGESTTVKCITTSLGYYPDWSFQWAPKSNITDLSLSEITTVQSSYQNTNPECSDDNNNGTSILTAASYTSLDDVELCCQLTTENLTPREACTAINLPEVQSLQNATATVGVDLTLTCVINKVQFLSQVYLLHEDVVIGNLDYEHDVTSSSNGSVLLTISTTEDTVTVLMTLKSFTCTDAGIYTCKTSVASPSDHASMVLDVTKPAAKLTASFEGKGSSLRCSTSSLGFNPDYKFDWVLKNGPTIVSPPREAIVDTYQFATPSCSDENSGNSILTLESLELSNDTQLCCRLVNEGNYTAEVCKDLRMPEVQSMPDANATFGDDFALTCTINNINFLSQVTVLHDGVALGMLDFEKKVTSFSNGSVSLVSHASSDAVTVTMTRKSVGCSDGGTYTCYTPSDEKSMVLSISRPPSKPAVTLQGTATSTSVRCTASSLGYYPDHTFAWVVKRNNTVVATPTNVSSLDSYGFSSPACVDDNNGTSRLTASNYGLLNGAQVCCRLVYGSNYTEETCTDINMPKVQEMANATAPMGKKFPLVCTISYLHFLSQVRFMRSGGFLGILFFANNVSSVFNSNLTLVSRTSGEVATVTLTLKSVSCKDEATYVCQAVSLYTTDQSIMELKPTNPPETPTVTRDPNLAESQPSANFPRCTTPYLGYPERDFLWVIKRNNGSVVESIPSNYGITNQLSQENVTCGSSGYSELNTNGYVGLNNSQLCCRLVSKTNSSDYAAETCTDNILLVPKDFCTILSITKVALNPVGDGCYSYITCESSSLYFSTCQVGGSYCFNPVTKNCDKPVSGSTSSDPFKCTVGSPEYMPFNDTYPNKCGSYQWCVNARSFPYICPGSSEFSQERFVCENPSTSTYCGKLRTGGTTASETTTTSNPYVCRPGGPQYLPYSYTFPDKCGEYQWCVNGEPIPGICSGNTEFNQEGDIVCQTPSDATYCGKLRGAASTTTGATTTTDASATTDATATTTATTTDATATTTATTTDATATTTVTTTDATATTTVTTTDATATTTTTALTTTTATTTPGSTTADSFTCAATNALYLPVRDTYPGNCGAYQQCANGVSYPRSCPTNTVFFLEGYCGFSSSDSYCGQRAAALSSSASAP